MTTITQFVAVKTPSNVTVDDVLAGVGGKLFTVVFEKADKTLRTMNCRRGVTKHLKGGVSTIADKPDLVSVYDMKTGGYRCFNKTKVKSITVDGLTYQF